MQPASQDIWDKKYRLKTKKGEPVDGNIDDTYKRVAKALAEAEPTAEKQTVLVRALPLGAAPRGDPRRPHHLQRRRARAQARHQHHQLHGVGHHRPTRWTASWTRSTKPA